MEGREEERVGWGQPVVQREGGGGGGGVKSDMNPKLPAKEQLQRL